MKKILSIAFLTVIVFGLIYFLQSVRQENTGNESLQATYSSLYVPAVKDIDWYSSGRKAPKFEGLAME